MRETVITCPGEVPLEVEEQIDRICLRFEQHLQAGTAPALRQYLAEMPQIWQAALFRELVRVDLDYRAGAREMPRPGDYVADYPEFAEVLREVFPAHDGPRPVETELIGSRHLNTEPKRPPRKVGNYVIVRELGRGGMGVVYKAIQAPLGRHVALKVMAQAHGSGTEVMRFRREAEVASRFHHTNIVPIFEAGQEGETRYIAMQYIAGRDLHRFIREVQRDRGQGSEQPRQASCSVSCGPSSRSTRRLHALAPRRQDPTGGAAAPSSSALAATLPEPAAAGPAYFRRVAEIGRQVASALAYAHDQGVVHRDIKPTNLMLDSRETVWVTDFGLVKTTESDLTSRGSIVGTLRYLAPERLNGECDARSDIYALGLTMYELATLSPAFSQRDEVELLDAIHRSEPPPPRSIEPRLPRDLETIIIKASQKTPAQRYQNAGDLAEDLRRFLAGEPILARRTGPAERAWIWSKRHPFAALSIALFCGALFLVAVTSFLAASAARRHATELRQALLAASESEKAARESDRAARRQETEALNAKGRSNRLAARYALASALSLAEKNSPDRALFEMLHALEIDPQEPDEEAFRRVIRANLAAWSRQCAKLRFAFHLPGTGLPGEPDAPTDNITNRQIFVSTAGDRGCFVTVGQDQIARLWSFETGAASSVAIKITGSPFAVSRDGTVLACTGKRNQLYNLENGATIPCPVNPRETDRLPEFTPMCLLGRSVMSAVSNSLADTSSYRFWDARTGTELSVRLQLDRGDCFQVIDGDRGQPLLFVSRTDPSGTSEPRLEAWDLRSGARLTPPFPLDRSAVRADTAGRSSALFTALPRGDILRSPLHAEHEGPICSWDLATGRLASAPWSSPVASSHQLLTGEGRVLIAQCKDDRIRLFDLDSGRQLGGTLAIPGIASTSSPTIASVGMAISPDGNTLVTVERDGTVRGWELRQLREQSCQAQLQSQTYFPANSLSGERGPVAAIAPGGSRAFFGRGGRGCVIELDSGRSIGPPIHHPLVDQAQFSPDGSYLATATAPTGEEPPVVRIWDLRNGNVVTYESPKYIHGLRFGPDSKRLAVACVAMTVILDAQTGEVIHVLKEKTCAVNLAFSPDGRVLAVGCTDGWEGVGAGLRFWSPITGRPIGEFRPAPLHFSSAPTIEFSAGGKALVTLEPPLNEVRRYDPLQTTGRGVHLEPRRPKLIAVSPVHDRIATANSGGTVEVWSVLGGKRLWVAPSSGEVRRLQISPDGKTLAVVAADKTVRLWDIETGWSLGPQLQLPSEIAALAFAADGESLVTATGCGRLFRFGVPQPMWGSLQECTAAVERLLGMTTQSGELVLLHPDQWRALTASMAVTRENLTASSESPSAR